MTRDELEADWPLVIRHRAAVVRFLETAGTAASLRLRKVSRQVVVEGYEASHDISRLAAIHGLTSSGITSILVRAIRVARGFENGTIRQPKPRKTFNLRLTDVPAALIKDIDAWARMRNKSRREAACELIKVGLDVLSARAEKQAARQVSRSARRRKKGQLVAIAASYGTITDLIRFTRCHVRNEWQPHRWPLTVRRPPAAEKSGRRRWSLLILLAVDVLRNVFPDRVIARRHREPTRADFR
jgi:hypothetical protein